MKKVYFRGLAVLISIILCMTMFTAYTWKNTTDQKNHLKADVVSLSDAKIDFGLPEEKELRVMGSSTMRKSIRSITFYDTLKKVPAGKGTDVSAKQDRSVMAWLGRDEVSKLYNLYFAADGDIIAPENCTGLFAGYSNMEEINFNDCFDTSNVTDMTGMFIGCKALDELDLSCFNTSRVTSMKEMFCGVSGVEKLDISGFQTSKVKDMQGMFYEMVNLEKLTLGKFDTSNVTNMARMFDLCMAIKTLDLRTLETGNVVDMAAMFYKCMNLESVDISSFDVSAVQDMSSMFAQCYALKKLDLRNFDTRSVRNMDSMFDMCQTLQSLDLRNFDTRNVENMMCMFRYCSNLKYLDISTFDFSGLSTEFNADMIMSGIHEDAEVKLPKKTSTAEFNFEVVTFGEYEQDGNKNNGPEDIQWLVLEHKNGRALLLSLYALDSQPYHKEYASVTWEDCSLRKWLNNTFLDDAFTAKEQKAILLTNVDNGTTEGNKNWNPQTQDSTEDTVFLLSYKDAEKYFYSDLDRMCMPTRYAVKMGADTRKEAGMDAGWWWLRSPGEKAHHAAFVNFNGKLFSNAVGNGYLSVRPALWINVEQYRALSK